jgi:hypothetical protein
VSEILICLLNYGRALSPLAKYGYVLVYACKLLSAQACDYTDQ